MQIRAEQKNDWLVEEPFKDHKHGNKQQPVRFHVLAARDAPALARHPGLVELFGSKQAFRREHDYNCKRTEDEDEPGQPWHDTE